MKNFILFICVFLGLSFSESNAQSKPVKWNFSIEKIDDSTAYFVIKADIRDDWKVYGKYPYLKSTKVEQKQDDIPTIHVGTFQYVDASECTDIGPTCLKVSYSSGGNLVLERIYSTQLSKTAFDEIFGGQRFKYSGELVLKQKIKLIPNQRLKGDVYFMACNHEKCIPPTYVDFDILITE